MSAACTVCINCSMECPAAKNHPPFQHWQRQMRLRPPSKLVCPKSSRGIEAIGKTNQMPKTAWPIMVDQMQPFPDPAPSQHVDLPTHLGVHRMLQAPRDPLPRLQPKPGRRRRTCVTDLQVYDQPNSSKEEKKQQVASARKPLHIMPDAFEQGRKLPTLQAALCCCIVNDRGVLHGALHPSPCGTTCRLKRFRRTPREGPSDGFSADGTKMR